MRWGGGVPCCGTSDAAVPAASPAAPAGPSSARWTCAAQINATSMKESHRVDGMAAGCEARPARLQGERGRGRGRGCMGMHPRPSLTGMPMLAAGSRTGPSKRIESVATTRRLQLHCPTATRLVDPRVKAPVRSRCQGTDGAGSCSCFSHQVCSSDLFIQASHVDPPRSACAQTLASAPGMSQLYPDRRWRDAWQCESARAAEGCWKAIFQTGLPAAVQPRHKPDRSAYGKLPSVVVQRLRQLLGTRRLRGHAGPRS